MRRFAALLALALSAVAEDDLAARIAKLGHPDAAVRAQASAALEKAGKDAVPALRAALGKAEDPEVRARIAGLLDKLDWPDGGPVHEGLRLTLRLDTTRLEPGGTLAGKVRLASAADKRKALALETENPAVADALERAVRLVAVDAKGRHRAIGEFRNFNRGPEALTLEVAPHGTTTASVRALAGAHLHKGNDTRLLPPGEYRIYAVLGDALGGWDETEPPPLRSNEVRVRIAAPGDEAR